MKTYLNHKIYKIFLFVSILLIAENTYGKPNLSFNEIVKNKSITLEVHNKSLSEIAMLLSNYTELNIALQNQERDDHTSFSLSVKDKNIEETLVELLKNTAYNYKLNGNNIVIYNERGEVKQIQEEKKSTIVKIQGRVLDKALKPLVRASISIKGTTIGTVTNMDGHYTMLVPIGADVVYRFVGFKPKTIKVMKGSDNIDVVLEEDIQEEDEVMVVAYGTTTRRSTTGSIASVKGKDLEGIPSTSISNLLQGRIAGVDITNMSGSPGGGGTSTVIRGYNSLDVEAARRFSNPLWIIDGVPMNSFTSPVTGTNMLSDINPDMIESVQVLKDAAAASIYGSRAANGVIVVTTKQGKKGQDATFQVNFSHTFSTLTRLPDITVGNMERRFRLNAMEYAPKAYYDEATNSWKTPTSYEELFNSYDPNSSFNGVINPFYKIFVTMNHRNGYGYQDSLNPFYMNQTNFFPMYTQSGYVTNANIQTFGGSERASYGIGLGYYAEDGVIKGSKFSRFNLTTSLNLIPAKKFNVDLRLNMSYSARKRGDRSEKSIFANYDLETVPGNAFELSSLLPGEGTETWNTLVKKLSGTKDRNMNFRTIGSFKVGYKPVHGLEITTMLSGDLSLAKRNEFIPSYLSHDGYSNSNGNIGLNTMVLNENFINYSTTIAKNHSFSLMGGLSYQYDQEERNYGFAKKGPSDKLEYAPSVGMPDYDVTGTGNYSQIVPLKNYWSDMTEKTLISYFGRFEYNFKQKYYISATFRRDGSSVFGAKNRWGTFPSIAGSWIISDEGFMDPLRGWLDLAKFRASWGKSGMMFSQTYLALGLLQLGDNAYMGNSTLRPVWKDGLYNDKLKWEETSQFDLGLDIEMFNYRFSITADYYLRITDDMLTLVPLAGAGSHTGYNFQWQNAASISNEGIELSLKYDVIRGKNVFLKTTLTGARNWNRFRESYNEQDIPPYIIGKPLNGIYAVKTNGYYNSQDEIPLITSVNGNYLLGSGDYNGLQQFKPGDINYQDINGDGRIDDQDRVYIGSALPLISGGWLTEFKWKNFDVNMSWAYQIGRHMINQLRVNTVTTIMAPNMDNPLLVNLDDVSFWKKVGDKAYFEQIQANKNNQYRDVDVEKVNVFKLKTLVVGYSLPRKILGKSNIEQIKFFVSGENLLSLHNYSGIDPETVPIGGATAGYDAGRLYPLARKITLGVTAKF